MKETIDILINYKKKLIDKKFYFDEIKNTKKSSETQIEINKIKFCIENLIEQLNNQLQQEKKINQLIETIDKLELVSILHGIDNFNFYLTFKLSDLLDLVKENRENKIVRIPIQHYDKKPIYKFIKDKNGRLIFNGKI